ncbi:MAG TPA: hypothetical protein VJ810_36820 [Blastocatellia bacterium]|nr:hypothetical protein [Blastocatellia bacterium]
MLVDYVRVYQRRVTSVSAASYSGPALASESIAAAFGANLATATRAATSVPLPTELAGTTVRVKDSGGAERMASIFYVTRSQVNFQIPPGTAPGAATVTVTDGDGTPSIGAARIEVVAPSLFAANSNGEGVAAAVALRIKADGSRTFESVSRFDTAQNLFVSVPIDLGPDLGNASDQVFLLFFGTGIRFSSGLSAVSAAIGGVNSQVTFAGAQGEFVGLDQINIGPLQRSLAGRGEINMILMAEGKSANTVKINIQ